VFPQYFLRSFGYVGVVVIATVSTLFVMPALFVVLGHRVNGGRLPWANRTRSATRAPLCGRLAATVMRRPALTALTALPVLAVLLLAASPLLGITFGTPDERVLPEDATSRQQPGSRPAREPTPTDSPRRPTPATPHWAAPTRSRSTW